MRRPGKRKRKARALASQRDLQRYADNGGAFIALLGAFRAWRRDFTARGKE